MKKFLTTCLTLITAVATIAQPENVIAKVSTDNSSSPATHEVESVAEEVIVLEDDLLMFGGEVDESVTVGIGTKNPSSLASLDLGDKDKGFLVNRLTAREIGMLEMSLGVAEEGMVVYSIDRGNLIVWNGVRWIPTGTGTASLDEDLLIINDQATVDLSKYQNSDQQDLTSAVLNGKTLTISIENGDDVSVDLSPIFADFEARIAALEKSSVISLSDNDAEQGSKAKLYQNSPNPIQNRSSIRYMVPKTANSAQLKITNSMGKTLVKKELKPSGIVGQETIDAGNLASGVYYSTLIVDGQKIDTKKMIVD